jgi:putative transposase
LQKNGEPAVATAGVVVMRSEVAVSERRACVLMQIYRRMYRYVPRPEDLRLRVRLRELAAERRRFGYRRLTRMLVREAWKSNHKRVYRLYVEEKLSLRRKLGRRRRAESRLVLPPRPTQPDHLWTMDFASDAFTSGRKFRTLNLMDGFTREALEIEPDTSLPGARGCVYWKD